LTVALFGSPMAIAILELPELVALAFPVDKWGLLWLPVDVPVGFTFPPPWVPPCVLPAKACCGLCAVKGVY